MSTTYPFPYNIPVADALELIHKAVVTCESAVVRMDLRHAMRLVLAEDIRAPFNVPGHDNSAMDGFALRFSDLSASTETRLSIKGASFAGQDVLPEPGPGECSRVMTGARMPPGTDTVVMKEVVKLEGDIAVIPPGIEDKQNVRFAGEDLQAGEVAIAAGTRLMASHIGVIASLGLPEVMVCRKPRVAFFSSGDELLQMGQAMQAGRLYDSNRYSLWGLLAQLDVEIIDLGVIRDDTEALRNTLRKAAGQADLVLSSGGVSAGDADFLPKLLEEEGQTIFWKMHMRPGHPLLFGRIGKAFYMGLPGNPVSVMACFCHFARPLLKAMAGESPGPALAIRARLKCKIKSRQGRTEFQRGIFERDENGEYRVVTTGAQSSGMLTSMSMANCFIVLSAELGALEEGDWVDIEPFSDIMMP